MESELSLFGFELDDYIISCTFLGDKFSIKAQPKSLTSHFLLSLVFDSKTIPDHFRHSSLNSPFKLYHYLRHHMGKKLKLEHQTLIILLEEDQPKRIKMNTYILDEGIFKDHQKSQNKDFLTEKKVLNEYKNRHFWDKSTLIGKRYAFNDLNLTKLQNGWQKITSLFHLQQKMLHSFKFKIVRFGGDLSIGFGVIKGERKKQIYSGDLDQFGSIGIWSKQKLQASCICNDGEKVHEWDKQLFVGEGDVFNIIVDLIDHKSLMEQWVEASLNQDQIQFIGELAVHLQCDV